MYILVPMKEIRIQILQNGTMTPDSFDQILLTVPTVRYA
jgi:hypothetical protein